MSKITIDETEYAQFCMIGEKLAQLKPMLEEMDGKAIEMEVYKRLEYALKIRREMCAKVMELLA